MNYSSQKIKSCYESWQAYYSKNIEVGDTCLRYSLGNQWSGETTEDRALIGEESYVFNLALKHLLRVKGEAQRLDLALKIKGENIKPDLLKEGRYILEHLLIAGDNAQAFSKVLSYVYDYGYSALLVTTKQDTPGQPSEIPSLQAIENPKKAFFDPACQSQFKTDGRFCGVCYEVPKDDFFNLSKELREKNSDTVSITDFWYREPYQETWYLNQSGSWVSTKPPNYLITKKVVSFRVKYMRLVDEEIYQKPIDYYTDDKLPLVYWRGIEGNYYDSINKKVQTMPYLFNLMDCQSLINHVGSSIVGKLKKMGGAKVIVTDKMIEGKEAFWEGYEKSSGIIQINETDEGGVNNPVFVPENPLDASLLNTFQTALQVMDQLAGINPAQQGEQLNNATNAGLHRQIMQGNILQNVILANHIASINEVGRILKQMIPKVVFEDRTLANGYRVNYMGKNHTPSKPQIRNDLKELFCSVDYEITYGASSDAERENNLMAIREVMQTNPNLTPYLVDEFVNNLNTANKDVLARRVRALMPPGIREVGEGLMTIEEYQEQQKKQEAEQQQPDIPQQKLELDKQKFETEAQFKQQELDMKKQKMQQQGMKDVTNLQIKAAGVQSKSQPKEMIYETEKGGG